MRAQVCIYVYELRWQGAVQNSPAIGALGGDIANLRDPKGPQISFNQEHITCDSKCNHTCIASRFGWTMSLR